jgi:tetratricopeptide (TPR) repeat protein
MVLGAGLALGACAALGGSTGPGRGGGGVAGALDLPWWRPTVSTRAAEALDRAQRLSALGRYGEALAELVPLADEERCHLEVHRRLQDAAATSTADWWVRRRYRARLDAHPDDPDAWYLMARIEPDRERQEALFEEALERDPEHPYARLGRAVTLERSGDVDEALREAWRAARSSPSLHLPWLFLGVATLSRGDTDAAERFLGEARVRAPVDPFVWLALAELHRERDDALEASRAALQALEAAPGDPAIVALAGRTLLQAVVPDHLRAAESAVANVVERTLRPGVLEIWRARWLLELGSPMEAAAALRRARAAGRTDAETAPYLRRALASQGLYREAVSAGLSGLPPDALGPANLLSGRWIALDEAATAAEHGGPDAWLRLAEAMRSVGWLDEAEAVATHVLAERPGDRRAARVAGDLRRFRRVLEDLRAVARRSRVAIRLGDPGLDVARALDVVGAISRRHLGVDASEGALVRNYPLLGEFAVSIASSGPFADEFGQRGTLLLVAARGGEPAAVVLSRLVSVRADEKAEMYGRPVAFDECLVEVAGLPPELAGLQGGLAGLTLDRLVVVELDAFRTAPSPPDPAFPLELRRASGDEAGLVALDTPSLVAARLDGRLEDEGGRLAAHLDAVRWHEIGHVLDARLLLPQRSPLGALRFALQYRFRPHAMEQALEARAAVSAMVHADSPRAAFAQVLSSLPATEGATAHAAAYHQVVRAVVEEIAEAPWRYPSIDPERNLAQQLDVLTDDEVRDLGVRLAGRF